MLSMLLKSLSHRDHIKHGVCYLFLYLELISANLELMLVTFDFGFEEMIMNLLKIKTF